MSDPVSVASATIALLDQATKAQESHLHSHNALEDVKKVKLNVKVSLHKFQGWQETWSGQKQQPDVTAEALWGAQGWATIRRMLDSIVRASKELEACLTETQENRKSRSRWKAAVESMRPKKRPDAKLQRIAATLSRSIDELWLYSEAVFDSLHGVMAQDSRLPSRDKLLTSALQSRAGSLELYGLCAKSTLDCSLAIDLLDSGAGFSSPMLGDPPNGHGSSAMHLFYQLFTQAHENPKKYQKMVIENVPEADLSRIETSETIQPNLSDLQLFKPRSDTTIVQIPKQGSRPASCLRIPKKPTGHVFLRSDPENLASVLQTLQEASNLSNKEHFSIGAKIELAYKIVESGFFLLGTPWFSSLGSKNLLRLKRNGLQRHSFMLEIQTLDFTDLLFDDSEALAETSQLFRIGVLLMEIALDKTDFLSNLEDRGQHLDSIRLLPEIEQSMGAQYCKATAFCLQHRQPRAQFRGPEKYKSTCFDDWKSYLAEFLQDYHSQVFLRYVMSHRLDDTS